MSQTGQQSGRRKTVDAWAYGQHAVLALAMPCICHTDRLVVVLSCVCGHRARMSVHQDDTGLIEAAAALHMGVTGETASTNP